MDDEKPLYTCISNQWQL